VKVLISAYACDPRFGSEPGIGWAWVNAAAVGNEVWVLTRPHVAEVVEEALRGKTEAVPRFVYVDLPRWAKLGGLLGRRYRTYYTLWQLAAARRARALHAEVGFDVVHHLTWANGWYPALTFQKDAAFVLGPVGGALKVPVHLLPSLGPRGACKEVARRIGQLVAHINPVIRAVWRRADVIVVLEKSTLYALPRRYRRKAVVRHNLTIPEKLRAAIGVAKREDGSHIAVLAGRLLPWKGEHLAIRALATAPEWRLKVVGSGPDLSRLRALTEKLELNSRVEFVTRVSQHDLWEMMRTADVLLVPSLRDDGPTVSIEAQALGLPVIALDQGGPAELAKAAGSSFVLVPLTTTKQIVSGLSNALLSLGTARPEPESITEAYGVERVSRDLATIYSTAVRNSTDEN